jgi:hypothetical protein
VTFPNSGQYIIKIEYEYELPYDDTDVPRNGISAFTRRGYTVTAKFWRVRRKRFPYHTLHELQDKYEVPSLGKPKFNRMRGWDFPIKLIEKT